MNALNQHQYYFLQLPVNIPLGQLYRSGAIDYSMLYYAL